ncbi:MAG TPA: leucine-rich repeat protein [Candidatus Sulfotelmatobacter sp.]|jgi:hypothetical protein|nr:leucine-rich repeat protein [Candidatus Sulfotelmatobacter sp.]
MRHQIKLLLLTLLLLASSDSVWAQFTFVTNTDNTIAITGYNGDGGEVSIPCKINGLLVTSIGSYAFSDQLGLTNVTISYGIVSIGQGGFEDCINLAGASIPNSITKLEIMHSHTVLALPM